MKKLTQLKWILFVYILLWATYSIFTRETPPIIKWEVVKEDLLYLLFRSPFCPVVGIFAIIIYLEKHLRSALK